jgi:hypothetical protein
VLQGSFAIQNTIDVASLTPYSEITGDLVLNAAGITSISLPNLCKVDGFVHGTAANLITLDLPALTSVSGLGGNGGGLQVLNLDALTNLNAPSLASAPMGVAINVGPSATITLSSLTGSILDFYVNEQLGNPQAHASLNAPMPMTCPAVMLALVDAVLGLTSAGQIDLAGANLSAPGLTTVQNLSITEGSSVNLPALVTVTSSMTLSSATFTTFALNVQQIGTFNVTGNTALTTIGLPALTSGTIILGAQPVGAFCGTAQATSSNPSLVQLNAPQWTSGSVTFWDHTFPNCRATAICAQLGEASSTGKCGCWANQATSPCP